MEGWEREYEVARIIGGEIRYRDFIIGSPSRRDRFLAHEVYKEVWREANLIGVLTSTELYNYLLLRNIWTAEYDKEYKLLTEKVEDLKVGLYENWCNSTARFEIRHALNIGRAEINRLDHIRHGLDHITCEGVAGSAKVRCLIASSIKGGDARDDILEEVIEHVLRTRLAESEFRELARTEPWRSIWSARQHAGRGLFDAASVDLSDEQRTLVLWSSIYDSIKEHSDSPADDVIEDDDMIDGWLIAQRRKREASQEKKHGDEIANAKIREADEVYILTDAQEARKVEKLNDINAQNIKKTRMAYLKQHGQVSEMQMPDTQQRFHMELARLEGQKIRNG